MRTEKNCNGFYSLNHTLLYHTIKDLLPWNKFHKLSELLDFDLNPVSGINKFTTSYQDAKDSSKWVY